MKKERLRFKVQGFGILLPLLVLMPVALVRAKSKASAPVWVRMENGRLAYGADEFGNRVPDFSTAGYEGGGVAIPDVPVRATLEPAPTGDDTPRIQAALDALALKPVDASGFHGALLLSAGEYRIAGTLQLNTSGIVLRGAGNDARGTVLAAEGMPHTVVQVAGNGAWQRAGPDHALMDDYVPVGADAITVGNAQDAPADDLKPGDRVIVQWKMTQQFIHTIGMDELAPRKDSREVLQWQPGMGLNFDRRIVRVDRTTRGAKLTLDAPLTNAMSRGDGTVVWRYTYPGRIDHVGIEHLRTDGSAFEKTPRFGDPQSYSSDGGTHFVGGGYFDSLFAHFDAVENAWMRNVVVAHYPGIVSVGQHGRAVTIAQIQGVDINTPHVSAPPQAFSLDGQQSLVEDCNVTGAFNHVWMTQARVAGPNVFLRCTAKGFHLDAGPHQRWATGTLYDSLRIEGAIHIENRGSMGTGHGWAGANNVMWNCQTDSYLVESPRVAYNWAFGSKGSVEAPHPGDAPGQIVSPGKPVEPGSLYEEQLRERLAAVKP